MAITDNERAAINTARDEMERAGFNPLPLKGKVPLTKGWQTGATATPGQWAAADSIGVRCGDYGAFQLVCVDFDKVFNDEGETVATTDALQSFNLAASSLPVGAVYIERSPHGFHAFFLTTPSPVIKSEKLWFTNEGVIAVETRAAGSQTRLFPSAGCSPLIGSFPPVGVISAAEAASLLQSVTRKPEKPASVPAKAKQPAPVSLSTDSDNPADYLRENPVALFNALALAGWKELPETPDFWSMQRPGAEGADNHSIHIRKEGGAVTIWSSKLNSSAGESISPFNFLTNELYNGDSLEAGRAVRRSMPARHIETGSFDEFAGFEENDPPSIIVAPEPVEDWEGGIVEAVRFASKNPQAAFTLPRCLYAEYPSLCKMMESIGRISTAEPALFAAAFSAVGFLSSRLIVGEHVSIDWETMKPSRKFSESTANYCAVFAPTGAGKEAPRSFVASMAYQYQRAFNRRANDTDNEKRFYFSSVASAQSFADGLASSKKAAVLIDEVLDFIAASSCTIDATYLSKFWTDLKEYRSAECSNTPYIIERSRASNGGKGGRYEITRPAVSVYCTGVCEGIKAHIDRYITDGTFGRFNFFFADKKQPSSLKERSVEEIAAAISNVEGFNESNGAAVSFSNSIASMWGNLAAERGDKMKAVTYEPRAASMLLKFENEQLRAAVQHFAAEYPSLVSLAGQRSLLLWKTALTYAAARCTTAAEVDSLTVNEIDAASAIRFTLWQFVQISRLLGIGLQVDDGNLHQFIVNAIKLRDEAGGFTCNQFIAERKTQGLSIIAFKKYFESLERAGVIVSVGVKKRGRVYALDPETERAVIE